MMDPVSPIARQFTQILRDWVREAGEISASRGLSPDEITNIMPKYLEALAPLDGARMSRQRWLESHLSSRLRAGYRLTEVVEELSILGRCVVRHCGVEGDAGALRTVDVVKLFDALHQDTDHVIDAFAVYLREDEQSEKFYLRRLQLLAADALRGGLEEGTRQERFEATLELIREALGARSAAVMLYDAPTKTLHMAASVGVVEPPTKYVVDAPPTSFAAQVAAIEACTVLPDVAATELAVNDALRAGGVRALLGVRLPMLHELRGVLYVGVTEAGTLTARQARRLENLGEQLSLHIDRAALFDALHATIQDLGVEREMRERFISVLAHDLRGPLSVVHTAAELLCADADRLGAHRDLPARALRNAVRANRMIQDMLDVMRVRAGHGFPLTLGPCDLAEVARATLGELATIYGDRFVLTGDAHLTGVWSADALQRTLWNLCTNAVTHGAPRATVRVSLAARGEVVELRVHNEGPVIPEGLRAQLFRPFARGAVGAGGQRPGWGLGLSMVKSCAEAHGGAIDIESDATRGTTFTMTLPRQMSPLLSTPGPLRDADSDAENGRTSAP